MKPFVGLTLAGLIIAATFWFVRRGQHHEPRLSSSPPSIIQSANFLPHRAIDPNDTTSRRILFAGAKADTKEPPTKRQWDPLFLASVRRAKVGDPIRFELLGSQWAAGTIDCLQHRGNEVIYVAGPLSLPEPGRFFFQKQTARGVAGPCVGIVEFPGSQTAYRIEPTGTGGAAELTKHPLARVLCLDLPLPPQRPEIEEIPPLKPDDFPSVPIPIYQGGLIPLQSLAGAGPVIYLDFQGGSTPTWGGITYQRPDLSNAQIREVWKRVAEDFMPFNLNVTTDLEVFQNAPEASRQHVIITPTDAARPGRGGASYDGSFNWSGDTPCWVFITANVKACAEACSHEVGHTLWLNHAGQDINGTHFEYYYGHGQGETGWAPIMGVAYFQNVTHWSRGDYAYANNLEDQLAIITSRNNNVHFRADDTGDTLATSRYLEVYPDDSAGAEGVIETTGDTDAFQFTTGGGPVWLRADPVGAGPNLALQATLYDAHDTLLASNNPQTTLWASLATNLPTGTYTFRVTGAGRHDPLSAEATGLTNQASLTSGFSAYGSLGYYSITGSVAHGRQPNRFAIPEQAPNGTVIGVIPPSQSSPGPLSFTITSGNISNAFALDHAGLLTVADHTVLDYDQLASRSQLPVQLELLVDIKDQANPALNESGRRVVVAITHVNKPPTLTGFATSVLPQTPPGAIVGTVVGSVSDFYPLLSYAIVAGNSNGVFHIDEWSGAITVAGDLAPWPQKAYVLNVAVSDQSLRVPLTATATVSITVGIPPAGSVSCAAYKDLSGISVSALTNASGFPQNPAWEKQLSRFEGVDWLADNDGAAVRGYLLPPATGEFTFWISSRGDSELWLSDSSNPHGLVRIAFSHGDPGPRDWAKYPGQQSVPVPLIKGNAYYIEARIQGGTGDDNFAVAWKSAANGIPLAVIPGNCLAPYFMRYAPRPVGFTAMLHRDVLAGAAVGTVAVTDVNTQATEAVTITSGNEDGVFALDPATGLLRVLNIAPLQISGKTNYLLQVQATDDNSPPLSGTTTVAIHIVPPDAITAASLEQEVWTNLPGVDVGALTSKRAFPRRPDVLRPIAGFDSTLTTTRLGGNCGSRIRAYLTPTNSGFYTFFLASDAQSQLSLSLDADPGKARVIAAVGGATGYCEWKKYGSQQSGRVNLLAGQHYYLETLHKAGNSPGHVEVAWIGPGLTGINVIAGSYLTPPDLEYAPDLPNKAVSLPLEATNGTLVTTLAAKHSPLDTVVYRIVSGNLSNSFGINPATGELRVADNAFLATFPVAGFTLEVQAQNSGYGGLYPLKSTIATITVTLRDNTTPVLWTGAGPNSNWSALSNWNGALPDGEHKLIFQGTNRQTNHNDFLPRARSVTLLNGGFCIDGNPLGMRAGLTSVGNNMWAVNIFLEREQTFASSAGTLVLAGDINNNGFLLTINGSGATRLEGVLGGAGGLRKEDSGKLILTGSNTYTGPTTIVNFGVLAITNWSAIANSSSIEMNGAATLDVSGAKSGFVVPAGQALRVFGSGTIAGAVTVSGTLVATNLVFRDSLVLAGKTVLGLHYPSFTLDWLSVSGELRLGGELTVSIVDPVPPSGGGPKLGLGSRLRLFTAPRYSGAFTHLNLPPLEPGLAWDTSQLTREGTIQVVAGPPEILPVSIVNGKAQLRFKPAQGRTYVVETTTSLAPPIRWTTVTTIAGANGQSILTVQVPSTAPSRFFRLRVL